MKHTIYLTSGQTAEVFADGPAIEDGASIYFKQDGTEVARFKKELVAGRSSASVPLPSGIEESVARWCQKNGVPLINENRAKMGLRPIDTATGAASGETA